MKILKKSSLWIVLLIALSFLGYIYFTKEKTCVTPIGYVIGTFDSRFGISKSELVDRTEEASHVWENSIGKDLFKYDSPKKAGNYFQELFNKYFRRQDVVINLVYDKRQATADKNKVLVSQVDESKGSADEIKRQFLALENQYNIATQEYLFLLNEYKQGRGERDAVEAKRLEVNGLADGVNALVKKYNFLVTSVNTTIKTINQGAGKEFEEGLYISDSSGERINIYEFGSRDILVRVLAHEFGHVLGLEHNDNPDSIMYYLNSSKNIKPTSQDVAELKGICAAK